MHLSTPLPLARFVEADFEELEQPLTRDGPPIRLAVKYGAVEDASRTSVSDAVWLETLKTGDALDCLDKGRRWRAARVASEHPEDATLTVTFKGWSSKHDEVLPRSSPRIARPGSRTGPASRDARTRRQGEAAFAIDLEVLAFLELRIDEVMAGELPAEEQARR